MSSWDESIQEQVMALVKATGEKLTDEYYEKFSDMLCELGFSALTCNIPISLEIWKGAKKLENARNAVAIRLHFADQPRDRKTDARLDGRRSQVLLPTGRGGRGTLPLRRWDGNTQSSSLE